MSIFDHPLVLAADRLADEAHARAGQLMPYTGLPYIEHPREVAVVMAEHLPFPDAVAGALVHDCVADTDETRESIARALGDEVGLYAHELAEVYLPGWSRQQKVASEVERLRRICDISKGIKCADVIVNVRTIVQRAPDFARIYVPEKRQILPSLLGAHAHLYRAAYEAVDAAMLELSKIAAKRPRPRH
ncbi:(p)ppGpp synthase/HD superfamily hydrolase [Roseateles asaccharophilus]|uniref:HD domain-containing protein n=1 Tax=Roseateles asaccharophilus TaxID=582607 RepID=UPI003836934D